MREHVDSEGTLRMSQLIHVGSGDRSADIYTKALTGPIFGEHRERHLGERRKAFGVVIADNVFNRVGFVTFIIFPIVQGFVYFPCK